MIPSMGPQWDRTPMPKWVPSPWCHRLLSPYPGHAWRIHLLPEWWVQHWMEPRNYQVKTEGQGQWPESDGVRLPDTGLGVPVRWGWVSSVFLHPLTHWLSYTSLHSQEKPGLSSRPEKITMDFSMPTIFSDKLTGPSTSSRVLPMAGLKDFSYSTTCPAIKSMHQIPYQHETWWKVHQPFLFPITTTAGARDEHHCEIAGSLTQFLPQGWRTGGRTSQMVHACAVAHFQMASLNYFISLKTTPPCLAGSKAWRLSSGNVVYGLRKTFSCSAQAFIAPLVAPTAVASVFSFFSPISPLKSPSFKSLLSLAGIYAISILNTTVN